MHTKTTTINGQRFSFINEAEFACIYTETYEDNIYHFIADTSAPFIVDGGAHIGISVLYFKKLYPQARIVAFEPNPEMFRILELNVRQNDLQDVELVNAALSKDGGEMDFYICNETISDYTTWAWCYGGIKEFYDASLFKTIKIPSVKLSSYITQPVDMLKLDIEGMEVTVLEETESKLQAVKAMHLEFHSDALDRVNNLQNLIDLLERNHFQFSMRQDQGPVTLEEVKRASYYLVKFAVSRKELRGVLSSI